jgi:two-component system, NarL family, sensor histidine kinase BarA
MRGAYPLGSRAGKAAALTSMRKLCYSIGMRVLIIDDDPGNLDLQARIIRRLGYEVEIAATGEEGLELCLNEEYDIVFFDILLPGISGVEAVARLRDEGPRKACPIIALTGATDMGDFTLQGFQDVLVKPISILDFKRVLERWAPLTSA